MRQSSGPRPHDPTRRPTARLAIAAVMVVAGILALVRPGAAVAGDPPITGTVYRDANGNGTRDPAEAGQAGVTVSATDTTGATATALSGPTGAYSLDVTGLGAGPFRVEFSGWPVTLRPGPHGVGNPTSVSVQGAGATIDFGLLDPQDYCQTNPDLVVSCFVAGIDGTSEFQTLASFPYAAGAKEASTHSVDVPLPAGADSPPATKLATLGQTGSIYGQGWHARSGSLYLGAYAKKYVPLGPGGSGAIYVRKGGGAPSLFYTTGSTTNRTPPGGDWFADPWFDEIGKVGWGDLDVLGDTLYAVNLEDRRLYAFALDPDTGNLVGSGPSGTYPIPANAQAPGDSRPFGLGVRDGLLYIGGVDSAQSTGATPSAWIIRFDPATSSFSAPVATFGLGFNRGCAYVARNAISGGRCSANDGSANWRAWGAPLSSGDTPDLGAGRVVRTQVGAQPMLSDIEFDDAGNMTVGFRDRFGDQSGRYIPAGTVPNPISPILGNVPLFLTSYTFGDTLRLERTGENSWQLEDNGTSGGVTGTANSGMGPGGGEFYDADNSLYNTIQFGFPTLEGHDEVTMGGLYHQPSTPEMTTTAYDVFGRWDLLGVRHLTDTGNDAPGGGDATSLNVRTYAIFRGTLGGPTPFGKANGLGDLEALCDRAPIELGNFVWYDGDLDGVQDPDEKPIPGVTVTLRDAAGAPLATAVTDSSGRYWFASPGAPNLPASPGPSVGTVPGGIKPGTTYSMTFDASTAQTASLGLTPGELVITVANQGSPTIGSKPTVSGGGLPTLSLTTGGPGSNDHRFDAGYRSTRPPSIRLVKSVNDQDANTAPGPTLNAGDPVTFTYVITNNGGTTLTNIALSDDKLGAVTCPATTLQVGDSMTCTATSTVVEGPYVNIGTVTGRAPDQTAVRATDPANYVGVRAGIFGTTTTVIAPGPTTTAPSPPTSVLRAVETPRIPGAPLAATGADSRAVELVGFGLIVAGLGIVVGTRRRPR